MMGEGAERVTAVEHHGEASPARAWSGWGVISGALAMVPGVAYN